MTLIEARHLCSAYGGPPVLHDLSLTVARGEVLGLIGPNGAGKTTLLRALAGLLPPGEGGAVLIGRDDVFALSSRERAQRIGLVPQIEAHVWPVSVEHLVRLGRAAHRGWLMPFNQDDLHAVEEALERTALIELRQRPVTTLSGGERQRALIARALAQKPLALLLDEPTAHLDLRYQANILWLVRDLAHGPTQIAAVVSLHDLNQAALFTDRLVLIDEGRIIASGPPGQVLTAETLSASYGVPVVVGRHPVHGTPLVAPILPGDETTR
jgi:iron complex transport system ATP-binding protein